MISRPTLSCSHWREFVSIECHHDVVMTLHHSYRSVCCDFSRRGFIDFYLSDDHVHLVPFEDVTLLPELFLHLLLPCTGRVSGYCGYTCNKKCRQFFLQILYKFCRISLRKTLLADVWIFALFEFWVIQGCFQFSVFFFYKSVFRYWIFLNKMHMGWKVWIIVII